MLTGKDLAIAVGTKLRQNIHINKDGWVETGFLLRKVDEYIKQTAAELLPEYAREVNNYLWSINPVSGALQDFIKESEEIN